MKARGRNKCLKTGGVTVMVIDFLLLVLQVLLTLECGVFNVFLDIELSSTWSILVSLMLNSHGGVL